MAACGYPYLYGNARRRCICGGRVATCPCTPQEAMDHFVTSHIADDCSDGGPHPTVFELIAAGLPAPTRPCRRCGGVPQFAPVP